MRYYAFIIGILILVSAVSAVPNTLAASAVGNNNFTLSGNGFAAGDVWFMYGNNQAQPVWRTNNVTSVAGAASITEVGSPILPGAVYYAAACDSTGCDATPISFTTGAFVPATVPTLGAVVRNMTTNKFNLAYFSSYLTVPYTWVFPESAQTTGIQIVFGLLLLGVWGMMWLRTRSVATGVMMGLLAGVMFMSAGSGFNIGIPVEGQILAESILYVSIAGVFMYFLKK